MGTSKDVAYRYHDEYYAKIVGAALGCDLAQKYHFIFIRVNT
jgi:hypothetical protein